MKVFVDKKNDRVLEGGIHMIHEHRGPERPIPPHERKALMYIEFDETDWVLLKKILISYESAVILASAAAKTIMGAPPEIQVLAAQLMNIIGEVA